MRLQADVIAVANAGDGSVRLLQRRGFSLLRAGSILGDDADNIRLDPRPDKFLVGYGSGGIATLDPASGKVLGQGAVARPSGRIPR